MTIQFNRFTVAEYHSQRLSPVLRILPKNQVKDIPAKSIDNSMLGVSNEDVYNNKKKKILNSQWAVRMSGNQQK